MTQTTTPLSIVLRLLIYCALSAVLPHAISGFKAAHSSEVREDYDTRWRKLPKGPTVRPVDPNIYVYNKKFEQTFLMPPEWTSTELLNVDAVAMRVVADYGSCSWDDAREGCEFVPLRCEFDLYFDNNDHVLPWHAEAPEFWDSNYWSSSYFLQQVSLKAGKDTRLAHPLSQPFSSLQSGKSMDWSWISSAPGKDRQHIALLSYDQAALESTTRVSLAASCDDPPAALVLASEEINQTRKENNLLTISLPRLWQGRAADALRNATAVTKAPSLSQSEE